MIESVKNTAIALGLTEKEIAADVEMFLTVQGEDMALHALNIMSKTVEKTTGEGLHGGPPIKLWRWASKTVVADKYLSQGRQGNDQEQQELKNAYDATIKKGYVPSKEMLLAQIEGQYDAGDISQQQYDWGMAGLSTVFGYVAAAQEDDGVPF